MRVFVGIILFGLLLSGCSAPQGVRDAVEELKVPVVAMADRYAEIVAGVRHPDGPEKTILLQAKLLELGRKDFEQFEALYGRLVEWHEGSPFNLDEAKGFTELALRIKEELDQDKGD